MGTSDSVYDAGAYVDEIAALNERLRRAFENLEKVYADRDRVILRWQGALGELNDLHDVLAAGLGYPRYRDTEESPGGYPDSPDAYVTGDHTPVTLAMKAVRALAEAEASRQAWAAEAMRLSWIHEPHGAIALSDEIHPRVCACISDEQATQLGPGFSRPECAVHPEGPGTWTADEVAAIKARAKEHHETLQEFIE